MILKLVLKSTHLIKLKKIKFIYPLITLMLSNFINFATSISLKRIYVIKNLSFIENKFSVEKKFEFGLLFEIFNYLGFFAIKLLRIK